MEDKIKELELEIEVLKQRISYLEKIETRRKVKTIIKTSIGIILISIIAFGIYNVYQRIIEIYNNLSMFF